DSAKPLSDPSSSDVPASSPSRRRSDWPARFLATGAFAAFFLAGPEALLFSGMGVLAQRVARPATEASCGGAGRDAGRRAGRAGYRTPATDAGAHGEPAPRRPDPP